MPQTAPVTRVLLIRHGATTSTADDRFAGSSDVELSDEGRRQVAALGKRLTGVRIDAIYCSNLRRAIDSATIVGSPHGLTPTPMPELREIDHGHWEGVPHKQVETQFAAEYRRWSKDPFETIIPGGENGRAVLERAKGAVDRLVAAHPGVTIAVVSHKATNRLLISDWMGSDPHRYRDRLAQDLACLNIIDFRGSVGPQLLRMNDISHYDAAR